MAGPLRKLEFDIPSFELHVERLVHEFPLARLDLRGDAYGIGTGLIQNALAKVGVAELNFNSPSQRILTTANSAAENVLSGDQVFGYAQDGPGFARFSGTVVNVKRVPAGRRVSYGYTYTTSTETTLALVNLGYADGAVRRASSLAPVRIGDRTGVIAGRIAMDQFVVDVGDSEARPGDEAVLWGDPTQGEPSISQWSRITGISALALLSAVGPRVTRLPLHRNGGVM